MSEKSNQVVAIIGWGTAGVNAAIALRGAGYGGTIKAFSDTGLPPHSPILTSYYAGGEKSYDECFPWSDEALAELDVQVVDDKVVHVDPAARVVRTEEEFEHEYDKCVICVGARPTTVGFPEDCGYEPLVLHSMEDAVKMRSVFTYGNCKRVLVSGASMIALKSVEAALNCGLDVSLVGVNDHILDFSALPVCAERYERGLTAQGVKMRFGQHIESVRVIESEPVSQVAGEEVASSAGDTTHAERMAAAAAAAFRHELEVTFSGGDVERFNEIVVAHGVRSDFSFIDEGALEIDRALVVDDFMRTSDPDVYAAGDCAQALELISGQKRVLGIWKTAALQGQCAGRAIAAELAGGEPDPKDAYQGAIMTNTIAVNGTLFISAGESLAGEGRRVEVRETDTMTVACIYEADEAASGGERLVGFNVASDTDEPGGLAYDTAAMLTLRIEEACRR